MALRRRRSITFRLTAWIAITSTCILLLLGLLIGNAIERHFQTQDMALLKGKLTLVQHLLADATEKHTEKGLPDLLNDALIGHHGLAVRVSSARGVLYQSKDLVLPEINAAVTHTDNIRPFEVSLPDGRIFHAISVVIPGEAAPYVVTIATDASDHMAFMRSFSVTLWFFVGFAAVLTGLAVWLIAYREMAPLKKIRAEAAHITAQHLDQRLSTESIPQELVGLVETLNTMLARLEEAFARLSGFSSDLAHELRTPVTSLLTQTQVSLTKARTLEEYENILIANAAELERLARTINDMLFLAKADNALMVPHREAVNLRGEIDSLFDFYGVLAGEKSVRLVSQGDAHANGDRLMLRRALSNLISNAVRHTPEGGEVLAIISATDDGVSIALQNPGPDIPAEHLPRLFDRFYRVDTARQRFTEGSGLGLAIASSIVQAHGGRISVASSGGLTQFVIELPKAADMALYATKSA